jgi:MFS family permease
MVPIQALSSRVPGPEERARFMSALSVVQHLGAAAGALIASRMLREVPGGALVGMDGVASFAAALAVAVPALMWLLELRMRRPERSANSAAPRETIRGGAMRAEMNGVPATVEATSAPAPRGRRSVG